MFKFQFFGDQGICVLGGDDNVCATKDICLDFWTLSSLETKYLFIQTENRKTTSLILSPQIRVVSFH